MNSWLKYNLYTAKYTYHSQCTEIPFPKSSTQRVRTEGPNIRRDMHSEFLRKNLMEGQGNPKFQIPLREIQGRQQKFWNPRF